MFHPIDKWNVCLRNDLDVDMNITLSQNVQSKYVWMKKAIVHATTAKILVTARYIHLWNECLAMTNGKIMVRLKTETEHLRKRGDRVQDSLRNNISVWLDYIEFRTRPNQFECSKNMKTVYPDENNVVLNGNSGEGKKTMYK